MRTSEIFGLPNTSHAKIGADPTAMPEDPYNVRERLWNATRALAVTPVARCSSSHAPPLFVVLGECEPDLKRSRKRAPGDFTCQERELLLCAEDS